jgi:hypothetical protein
VVQIRRAAGSGTERDSWQWEREETGSGLNEQLEGLEGIKRNCW